MAEIIKANKYHKDSGYQFSDYSANSFILSNKFSEQQFFPKSKCKVSERSGGEIICHIPDWIWKQPKVKQFFRTEYL